MLDIISKFEHIEEVEIFFTGLADLKRNPLGPDSHDFFPETMKGVKKIKILSFVLNLTEYLKRNISRNIAYEIQISDYSKFKNLSSD